MPYLVKAMNQLTNIKTRLESPIKLTDASLFKAPLLFMEPIAGATQNIGQAASDKALWQARTMSGVDKYTDAEAENLRKYIVERGGFMYMLTHGNTPIAMRSAQKVLREILPEYPLRIVSNDHEIYRSFFSLGGPLRFPLREDTCAAYSLHLGPYSELKGVFVGDRLAILVDTESMMHILDAAAQHPFTGGYANYNKLMDELAPHAARQMINIIVYAMTHGSISDYSHYVPTKTADSSEALPTAPNSTMSKTAPVGR
ncbi:DUF4159 domain-containing protein [Candidatus Poribacteria bacterium]|nr:DUF4159 domain-containing protein [Candidatus Poribacteria bacterium]